MSIGHDVLMTLGFAGVDADYKEGVVIAVVFKSSYCEAGGACDVAF